jgi:hypothetical protein
MPYDPISAMLSPVSDEEELRALTDSLRGRSRAADFFALSTVGNIADAAKTEQIRMETHDLGSSRKRGSATTSTGIV